MLKLEIFFPTCAGEKRGEKEVYMTAREFLEYAGWKGELEKGLAILGRYVGKGSSYYISFPDTEVLTEDGEPLSELPDEPAGFQEYADAYSE
jgi:hypothetical protein